MAYLVTGSMGCLGVWTLYHLVKSGKKAVSFDLSDNRSRLDLLLSKEEQQAISFVKGDITDAESVLSVFKSQDITQVIHLAALQVPFCRANPIVGAQVNVVGTVNVFEAAKACDIKHLTFASSVAVYGPPESYRTKLLPSDAKFDPHTLYGVYKLANEGTAKIYWQDHQISSIVLRPYTVYGVARDQGLTSEPTKAMLAAAAGKPFDISFGGVMQFHFASDVARQFIEAAESKVQGAFGFNLGTEPIGVADMVAMIKRIKPDAQVTSGSTILPFPEGLDNGDLKHYIKTPETRLEDGVAQTIEHFETCLESGLLKV
jgi:nucleoside-diphosphate-sugar epimerase